MEANSKQIAQNQTQNRWDYTTIYHDIITTIQTKMVA